ncbi:MAG TPA: hypothetical protein VF857_06720, partial [Spirochaetota bacterium]
MDLFLIGIYVILIGGICSLFPHNRGKSILSVGTIAVGSLLCCVPAVGVLLRGGAYATTIPLAFPYGDLLLVLDPLSAFFVILIAVGGSASSLYGAGYLSPYRREGKS